MIGYNEHRDERVKIMEKSAIRMIAKMVSVNKIEVQLIRRYYEGNCPRFYLRDLNNNTLIEIEISAKFVEEEYVHYYFDNVEIGFFVMFIKL